MLKKVKKNLLTNIGRLQYIENSTVRHLTLNIKHKKDKRKLNKTLD